MNSRQLWFTGPRQLEIRQADLPEIKTEEVLVRTLCSGISAGTEMLAYRGQLPSDIPLDASLPALKGDSSAYPFQYGYASVGVIESVGKPSNEALIGKRVFVFNPHASYFYAGPEQLVFIPDSVSSEAAVFIANMETAVNLMIDGEAGEKDVVVIIGLGVVGQLLLAILQQNPPGQLICLDKIERRRNLARQAYGVNSLDPEDAALKNALTETGATLVFELSGNPQALNQAIDLCGFAGRIVVGSWYGNKTAALELGGSFHRNRLSIISSQVSTISPAHAEVWNKEKRMQKALSLMKEIKPEKFITHRFPLSRAAEAYRLLDEHAEESLQVVINYEE